MSTVPVAQRAAAERSAGSRETFLKTSVIRMAVCLLLFPSFLCAGCRKPPSEPAQKREASRPAATATVPGYAAEQLTALGAYLPDLDEGRVQVAPPVDWRVAPRSKDYLVRFLFDRSRRMSLPRITIQVRDAESDEPHDLNAANVVAYVDVVGTRMDAKTCEALNGIAEPLELGDMVCVRYVVHKRFRRGGKQVPAECEVVTTIRGGRVYTISLDVVAGSLVDFRADAYAVMAGLRFPHAESEALAPAAASGPDHDAEPQTTPQESETAEETP